MDIKIRTILHIEYVQILNQNLNTCIHVHANPRMTRTGSGSCPESSRHGTLPWNQLEHPAVHFSFTREVPRAQLHRFAQVRVPLWCCLNYICVSCLGLCHRRLSLPVADPFVPIDSRPSRCGAGYARHGSPSAKLGICTLYAVIMHIICFKYAKNLQIYSCITQICKQCARNMPEICLNMQVICRYMLKICRYSQ